MWDAGNSQSLSQVAAWAAGGAGAPDGLRSGSAARIHCQPLLFDAFCCVSEHVRLPVVGFKENRSHYWKYVFCFFCFLGT